MQLYYSPSGDPKQSEKIWRANADCFDDNEAIRSRGSRFWDNYDTNITVRTDFNRSDYDYFREYEKIPSSPHEVMDACQKAYEKVGPIHNVIDLMGDFGCQGIRIQHKDRAVERFYQRWWFFINGGDRSERFLNCFYRLGTVVMRRYMGKVTSRDEKAMKRIRGEDISIKDAMPDIFKRNLPLKYVIQNPHALRIVGGETAASFIGKPRYIVSLPYNLRGELTELARSEHEDDIEGELVSGIVGGTIRNIPLPPDEIECFFYKKDDWELWGRPMIFSILDDVVQLSKMKLADNAALDGIISSVRLWRLGHINEAHPTHSILPTRVAINKLRNILKNRGGGGPLDIVWGPELDFKESESKYYQVLGAGKYEAVWDSIYDGLGIPPVLRSAKASGGQTTNFISLKTLIERLQYGRMMLTRFWDKEIKIVQEAMGFSSPAKIVFDNIIVNDESAEKRLLIDLIDRNVISEEAVIERFGYVPDIESSRVKRLDRSRKKGRHPAKASPFHSPNTEHDLKKIVLQRGGVAPSEVGLELLPRKPGEKTAIEQMPAPATSANPKKSNTGRPKNVVETSKRQQKRVQPRTKGSFIDLFIWANSAQEEISEIVTPALLHSYGKKNLRQLSREEFEEYECIKFSLLANIQPYSEITADAVYCLLDKGVGIDDIDRAYGIELVEQFVRVNSRKPTVDEQRQIQAAVYSLKFEEVDDGDGDNSV